MHDKIDFSYPTPTATDMTNIATLNSMADVYGVDLFNYQSTFNLTLALTGNNALAVARTSFPGQLVNTSGIPYRHLTSFISVGTSRQDNIYINFRQFRPL